MLANLVASRLLKAVRNAPRFPNAERKAVSQRRRHKLPPVSQEEIHISGM